MSHARLSPSSRHRWQLCPGSVREEAKFPEQPSGPSAIDGTHTHTLLEACINMGMVDPYSFINQTLKDHEGEFTVAHDRAARVKVALDYIQKRVTETGAKVVSERKVNPEWLIRRPDMPGTVDVQLIGSDFIELIDYKDGINKVEAKDNPQLEQYGVGVLAEMKIVPNVEHPYKTLTMTVIQPKLTLKGQKPISSHEVPVDELLGERLTKMALEANATDDPDAPLVSGDVQCKYCRAKGSCKELTSNVMKEVGVMFDKVDMAQQAANKDPNQLSDDEVREIVEAGPLLRQLLDSVEAEALRRFNSGHDVPGLKLVKGRGSYSWALPEDEMGERLVKMGIPKAAAFETKLVSPAKAKKLSWTKKDGSVKQLSDRQIKTLESEYIKKSEGKLTVVSESDERPAVTVNAAPMFGSVDQPQTHQLPDWLASK